MAPIYLMRLAAEIIILSAALASAAATPWAIVPAWIVIGSRQQALGELGHMAAHRLVGLPARGSDGMARLCLGLLGLSLPRFRAFHLSHHRHVGDPELDPEVALQMRFRSRWTDRRWTCIAADAVGLHADEAAAILRALSTPASLGLYGAGVAAATWAIGPAALLWPLAAGTTTMAIFRARAWSEHDHLRRPGVTLQWDRRPPALWRRALYLPWGVWRHFEHHQARVN